MESMISNTVFLWITFQDDG